MNAGYSTPSSLTNWQFGPNWPGRRCGAKIGLMYFNGEGVTENDAEAVKWFRKAAEQGDALAQKNLGVMYVTGEGVPVNNVKAYMWWALAKAQGDEGAAGNLDIIKEQMTPADISKAQALVDEWWEKHNN